MAHGEPAMGMHCIKGILKGKCFLHPPIDAKPYNFKGAGQDETIEAIKSNPNRRTVTFVNDHEQPFNVSLKSFSSNDKKFVVGFRNDLKDLLQLLYINKTKRTEIAFIPPNEIIYQTIFLPIPSNCAYLFIKQNGVEVRKFSIIKSAIQTASGKTYQSFIDEKRNVRLYNDHNQMVAVYWNPYPGDPLNNNIVYNGLIDTNSYADQRTFYGHAFVFKLIGNDAENNLVREVIIRDEPILTVTGADPPVSALLSQVSTQLIPPLPVLKSVVATLNPGDSKTITTNLYKEYIFTNIVTLKQLRTVQVIGPSRKLLYSVTGTHKDDPEWRNIWPRPPCRQYCHPPHHAGGIIELSSKFPFSGMPQKSLNLHLISLGRIPRAFTIHNLINDAEANYIIESAKSKGLYDSVVGSQTGESHGNRVSKNTFISKDKGLAKVVSSRVYEVLGLSYKNGDQSCNLQVAYYMTGGQYRAHTDFFDPFQLGNEHEGKLQGGENRWASVIIYLNTPGGGGGTSFPDAEPVNLVVKAEKGKGLLWYHMFENGNFDISSRHQGDIVEKGEKWIATYFCWDKLLPF